MVFYRRFAICITVMCPIFLQAMQPGGMQLVPAIRQEGITGDRFVVEVPDTTLTTERETKKKGLKEISLQFFKGKDAYNKHLEKEKKKSEQEKRMKEAHTEALWLVDELGLSKKCLPYVKEEIYNPLVDSDDPSEIRRSKKMEKRARIQPQKLVLAVEAIKKNNKKMTEEMNVLEVQQREMERSDCIKYSLLGISGIANIGFLGLFFFTVSFQIYNYFLPVCTQQ